MWIIESDGPPSWSLDASKTGESTKFPWVGEHHPYPRVFCILSSFARVKRPRWRPVGLNDPHLRSHEKIGDCEQSIHLWCSVVCFFSTELDFCSKSINISTCINNHPEMPGYKKHNRLRMSSILHPTDFAFLSLL